jgi:hypothetical protein
MKSNNSKPRRVDFLGNDSDYEAAFLGSLGFSTRCIMQKTKLRPGQITYRLKKAAIRRVDYRDGNSDMAVLVLRNMRPALDKEVMHYLQELEK